MYSTSAVKISFMSFDFTQHGREDSRSDFHGLTNKIVREEEEDTSYSDVSLLKSAEDVRLERKPKNGTRIFFLLYSAATCVIDGVSSCVTDDSSH